VLRHRLSTNFQGAGGRTGAAEDVIERLVREIPEPEIAKFAVRSGRRRDGLAARMAGGAMAADRHGAAVPAASHPSAHPGTHSAAHPHARILSEHASAGALAAVAASCHLPPAPPPGRRPG
jgi:type IV secretory pathway TrbL component